MNDLTKVLYDYDNCHDGVIDAAAEVLVKIKKLINRYDEFEDLPDDWNPNDRYGGNMDDAFNGGVQHGEESIADELRSIIKEAEEKL
jgi:hypothetical protein